MSADKLSSDEVPQKFAEWLLAMGCPPDVVPSVEKVAEMCRGQYYMVWRSLMEHVKPKDSIKQKRLQVFCDDIERSRKRSPFNEEKNDTNAVMPEELQLWHQQNELKDKVRAAENRNVQARCTLNQVTDKISMKMSQRNHSLRRLLNAQRRSWLLQQVAQELKAKKSNLQETKTIAGSLCSIDEGVNMPDKLDKCMSILREQSHGQPPAASCSILSTNPAACSSVMSTQGDNTDMEEQVSSLVRCGGALWPLLCSRRASLATALASASPKPPRHHGVNAQSVLAHTAALHCSLGIECMKNRVHIEQTQKRFIEALTDLNNYLSSPEEHELAVVRCEHANVSGRVTGLRSLLSRLESRSGDFAVGEAASATNGAPAGPSAAAILPAVDRNIVNKKEELKRLLTTLAATEKKISNIRDCLVNIFGGFHKDLQQENEKYKNFLDFPQESIASLRQFYEARRERRKNKMELSLNLDVSDNCSFTMATENNPTYADELKIYMKKFNLENNRKLVLESGEKIWIFESVQAAVDRLHAKWLNNVISCPLICPSVTLDCNLRRLIEGVHDRELLTAILRGMEHTRKLDNIDMDISSKMKEEEQTIDKIKKRLNENLISLQKTSKTLELGQENLKFWSTNRIKDYISTNRKCNDRIYKDYECLYVEKLGLNII